ncbi:MAG: acyl-CoA dehydrogenase family protein [Bacillota bacterium]
MKTEATPEEQKQYRLHVREWLQQNLPAGWGTPEFRWPDDEKESKKALIEWENKLYQGGFSGISWPKEYGGQGLGLVEEIIFNQEFGKVSGNFSDITGINDIGKHLLGPTLLIYGTEEQKKRFIPPLLRGEEIWCQGFSEPNAGSDLASLQTRAVLDGDEWVINGQKTWTSQGHNADWIFILARTNPDAPKHKGITFFLAPMNTPGISIQQVGQMNGSKEFTETFLDNVRVPKDSYVGKLNDGWNVTMALLGFERAISSAYKQARYEAEFDRLFEVSRELKSKDGQPVLDNPFYRQKLTEVWARNRIFYYHSIKSMSQMTNQGKLGPESSLQKLFWSTLHTDMLELAMDMFSRESSCMGEESISRGEFQYLHLQSRSETIYAGTSQIQKNIISKLILGM